MLSASWGNSFMCAGPRVTPATYIPTPCWPWSPPVMAGSAQWCHPMAVWPSDCSIAFCPLDRAWREGALQVVDTRLLLSCLLPPPSPQHLGEGLPPRSPSFCFLHLNTSWSCLFSSLQSITTVHPFLHVFICQVTNWLEVRFREMTFHLQDKRVLPGLTQMDFTYQISKFLTRSSSAVICFFCNNIYSKLH